MEAFDALTVATANVLSVGMMTAGGALWAFDISSLEDMRSKIRGGLGIDGSDGRRRATGTSQRIVIKGAEIPRHGVVQLC